MCLAVPVFARCRESLTCVPMLPHRRAQKRGCRVALSDVRFLLLLPAFPPMSGHGTDRHGTSGAVENSRPFANGRPTAARPTEEIVSTSVGRGAEGWSGQTAEPSGTPERCSSSEDCSKEKQEESLSLNSGTDSGVRTPLCRICFQGPEQGVLLSPCRCSGSVRCTHEVCLIKWISERGSWSCELCYYKYQVSAISTKNPLQWQAISLTMIERVQIAAAVLGSLFLLASVSWLIWSSLSPSAKWQRQDLLFQICYAMYGFMDLVCVALIVHEGPSVFRIFHRWQAVNQQWKVLNYDKVKDHEDHQKSGVIFRTLSLSLTSRGGTQVAPGTDSSPSTSSFMAAATATTAVPAATDVEVEPRDSPMPDQQQSGSGLMHLLSQLRGAEPWGAEPQGPCGRELVMRVTTV